MQNNVMELLERRARRLHTKRPSLRDTAKEMGISYYTLNGIIQNTIKEYPADVLMKLCDHLECNIGDLLSYEEVPAQQ